MIDPIPPNPFETAAIHPANCQFVLPTDSTVIESFNRQPQAYVIESSIQEYLNPLADRFVELGGLGQIVGPHGCGKSTLAIAMSRRLQDRFANALAITIRLRSDSGNPTGYWSWPNELTVQSEPIFERIESPVGPDKTLVILDGCERLSTLNQRLLVQSLKRSRQSNRSYLLTTHRAIKGVPMIASLQPEFRHFRNIVEALQQDSAVSLTDSEIAEVWSKCKGNYRDGLRALYDVYAERVSRVAAEIPAFNTAVSDVGN